jgi:undecaprenyl diphosphate synthase
MDGNGRWAKQQGQDRLFGHASGVESVRSTIKSAREFGVNILLFTHFLQKIGIAPKKKLML